jgi:hypothetical protein
MTIETDQTIAEPQAIRGALSTLASDEKVSFADVVLAHYLRQTSLYRAAQAGASSEEIALAELDDKAYRDRLAAFEAEHGRIIRAYWCSHEISGAAITEKEERLPWWRLRRKEKRERLHAATDWATRDCPELAHQLHKVDNLSVRSDEILRGTPENIAMQLLLAAASHILSYVDRPGGAPRDPGRIRKIVERSNAELSEIRRYYERAGANAARIVYAGGMLRGALLLAGLTGIAGVILWAAGAFERHATTTWTILATIAAGGVGAGVSVLLRMARGGFAQDYEVGRKATRWLATARPFVGAAFAVMIFLLLKSGLVDVGGLSTAEQTIYFYAAVGFLAGFSERWARVIVGGVLGADDETEAKGRRRDSGEAQLTRPEDVDGKQRTGDR